MTSHTDIPYIWNYLPLALQILVALGLAAGMVAASFFVGKHKNSRTKLGAYECGMDPVGDARGRFSVRFYMVGMLFILFDVEAIFLYPWVVVYRDLKMFAFVEMLIFVVLILSGFFYIWKKGALDWSGSDLTGRK